MASNPPLLLPASLLGYGSALPARIVTSEEVDARCGFDTGWIEQHTGVARRHWATHETALSLGAQAAEQALERAGCAKSEVDLLINASGTPHQAIPDGGPLLQHALGLQCPAFSVHATCLSFLLGLEAAARWLATGGARRVLLITSDIGSGGLNFAEPESAGLIGDGAAAFLLGSSAASGLEAVTWRTHGAAAALTEIRGCGTARHPNAAAAHASDQLFHMDGRPLLKFVLRHLPSFLENLPVPVDQHDWLIPHQASKAGLALLQALDWPPERTLTTLRDYGNCIAASIPLTLIQGLERGQIQPGQRLLLAGSGAGVSFGALTLRY